MAAPQTSPTKCVSASCHRPPFTPERGCCRRQVRAIPGVGFTAPWFRGDEDRGKAQHFLGLSLAERIELVSRGQKTKRWTAVLPTSSRAGGTLPRSVYESLSPAGQRVAARLACEGEEVGVDWKPDWDVEKRVGGGGGANPTHKGEQVSQLPGGPSL